MGDGDRTLVSGPSEGTDRTAATAATRVSPARAAPGPQPCRSCGTATRDGWRFCKACGLPLAPAPVAAAEPAAHSLDILVAPKGIDRISWELGERFVVGRDEQGCDLALAEDTAVSSRHARFEVRRDRCFVQDLGSTNGTFVSLRGAEALGPGVVIRLGTRRLLCRAASRGIMLVEMRRGGAEGRTHHVAAPRTLIGKEGADISFPGDRFVSREHAEIRVGPTGVVLRDLGSLNGTFVMARGEREIADGDRVQVGDCVFRYRRLAR